MSSFRRALLGTAAVLGLMLAGVSAAASPASAANRVTIIHTVNDPNLVIDLEASNPADGTRIILYPRHGGANQRWEIVPVNGDWSQLRSQATGKCLVNTMHSTQNGNGLSEAGCNPNYDDQLWVTVPVQGSDQFTIVNKYSGKCMDQTLNARPLSQVTQWRCHGLNHQLWTNEFV